MLLLVLTMKHRAREKLLQASDGGAGDVIGKVGEVGGPQSGSQVLDHGFGDGGKAIVFAPLE